MNRCTDERGQSMIEFAIALPLLATVLLLIGAMGKAMVDRQNLLIAARLGARERAIASLKDPLDILAGKGPLLQASAGNADALCQESLGKIKATCGMPDWSFPRSLMLLERPAGTHGHAFVATKMLTAHDGAESFAFQAGIGIILYGQKVSAPVMGIEPFARSLGGKFMGLQVSAQAYMPGSLPAHMLPHEGLLELNPWIGNEVK